MAALTLSNTPSPPPRVRTPQTPRHGYTDSWEPYSPRKSARISSQKANSDRTPSPRSLPSTLPHSSLKTSSTSFSTPNASPQKKRAPAMDSIRRASGTLTAANTASAADLLGIQPKTTSTTVTSARSTAGMLPTPAKTPRKQPDEKVEAGVRAIARNLFHGEPSEAKPSPRKKKAKKYTGLTLDSFRAEDVEEDITIFTDSRDRIPEVDDSSENPFLGEVTAVGSEPPKRRSIRKKKVAIPGEGRVLVEEAVQRNDGIVYVFRGKTFWKPCDDADIPSGEFDAAEDVDEPQTRRLTRSSMKPRLLFPPPVKGKEAIDHTTEDEEAATDIEDHVMADSRMDGPAETPAEEEFQPDTPKAPRFAPASPPTSARATRVTKKLPSSDTPIKQPGKSRSPFDGWRRSKSGQTTPHGQKREAEVLPNEGGSKRQRA